jgi:archaellum component FlaF (FlaF/FlaG flagellin family)
MLAAAALTAAPAGASQPFTAHLSAPNHTPTANKNWYVTVTATRNGVKLAGSVKYQFLFGGMVVSTQKGGTFKHGVYHDHLLFPTKSVGFPLTLRVVVSTKYGTDDISWSVKVKA